MVRELTEGERGLIVGAWSANKKRSMRSIAREFRVDPKTVSRCIKKWHKQQNFKNLPRSGRPRVTTKAQDSLLAQIARSNRNDTPDQLAFKAKLKVSNNTIKNRLEEFGEGRYIVQRMTPLRKVHTAPRLKFAKDHFDWKYADWMKVAWSDESHFTLKKTGTQWMTRPHGTSRDEEFVQPEIPVLEVNVWVWGCFIGNSLVGIEVWEGEALTKARYIKILDKWFKIINQFADDDWYYMDDGDGRHRGDDIDAIFIKHGVTPLQPWPASSPDLNPIENLWSFLKRRVQKRNPQNAAELMKYIKEEFEGIPKEFLENLNSSMCGRMRKVIAQKGKRIKK